jgi:hypothetical protein
MALNRTPASAWIAIQHTCLQTQAMTTMCRESLQRAHVRHLVQVCDTNVAQLTQAVDAAAADPAAAAAGPIAAAAVAAAATVPLRALCGCCTNPDVSFISHHPSKTHGLSM